MAKEIQNEIEAAQELAKQFGKPGERIWIQGEDHGASGSERFNMYGITVKPNGKLYPSVDKVRVSFDESGPIGMTHGR